MHIIEIMRNLFPSICTSNSVCRNFIRQNAVKFDDMPVEDEMAIVLPCKIHDTNFFVLAVVEGDARQKLLGGENLNVKIELDDPIIQSNLEGILSVGKKKRGIVKFTEPLKE